MPKPTAILVGATGLVGGHLLAELLAAGDHERVHVLARRPLEREHPRLAVHVVDFDRLDAADVPPADDVFCCLGTTRKQAGSAERFRAVDLGLPLAVARHARAQGARRFLLVSSVGADARSRTLYLRVKGELEDALRELGFAALHCFRPSMLVGARRERRPGEAAGAAVMRALSFAMVGGLRRYRPTRAEDVARAMRLAAASGREGTHVWGSEEIRRWAVTGAPDAGGG